MINICPCGRGATHEQREKFHLFDRQQHVRDAIILLLKTAGFGTAREAAACSHRQYDVATALLTLALSKADLPPPAHKPYNLRFTVGGRTSFDVVPEGWDKRYCLRHINTVCRSPLSPGYTRILFCGDRTAPGGNDHSLYACDQVEGFTVDSPKATERLLRAEFPDAFATHAL
jgi:hypothetical protein